MLIYDLTYAFAKLNHTLLLTLAYYDSNVKVLCFVLSELMLPNEFMNSY